MTNVTPLRVDHELIQRLEYLTELARAGQLESIVGAYVTRGDEGREVEVLQEGPVDVFESVGFLEYVKKELLEDDY